MTFALSRVAAALAALAVVAAAGARPDASLTLDVTFFANQTIAVTLPDGTPVGTTNGTPTLIAAGYYTVSYTGPMGLASGLPYFHLDGPGVDLLQNLNEDGTAAATDSAVLQPSSTYTWTDDAQPGVVHTFATTGAVIGTAGATPTSSAQGAPAQSQDVVGSDVATVVGTLRATIGAHGLVAITLGGKRVATLKAGRYRMPATKGLTVKKAGQASRAVSGVLALTRGRWTFTAGGRTVAVAVS